MFNITRENTGILASWWRNVDKQILIAVFFLFFLGLFFSFASTSSIMGEKMEKQTYFFFLKHLIFVMASLALLVFISIQERKKIETFLTPVFLISIFLLLMVPIIGVEVKGSKRWIDIALLPRFQPIEFVKPLFILMTAKIIASNKKFSMNKRYIFSFLILSFVIFLLVNQPDIGQTLLITLAWIIMIFVSGINLVLLWSVGLVLFSLLILIIYLFPSKFGYIFFRLKTFIDPDKGDNFQSQKALDAIKQGGLTGRGMGEGVLKDKVPEAHTDYIIAVISEEFGVLLPIFIVFIFLFVSYKVLDKIFLEKEEFIKLALVGLTSLFIIQTFIHIGVNTRLLPTTGMTIPFLSYGGSSLVGSAILAGIILNFTKKIPKSF